MKWIFLSLVMVLFSANAEQQYTGSACILLKQQIADYQRRLGKNSSLYGKEKTNFDTHCQNPITPQSSNIALLSNQQVKRPTKSSSIIKNQMNNSPIKVEALSRRQVSSGNAQPLSTQPNPFTQLAKMLMPMFTLLFLGLIAIYYFKKKLPQIKGRIGERHVRNGLTKHLDNTKYTIINDATLPLEDGGTTQIDHIVISNFGVFVIETKNMSGWIFGSEHQAKWTQTIHRSKFPFQNPLRQNYKHTKTLAFILDMPHELFHSVVVFTANAQLKTKLPENVGYLKEMMVYIKSFNENMFDNQEVTQIISFIENIKLAQGKKTDKQHVEYLKEVKNGSITS
tara:strand:- start:436 stop:1452 length:1017 start_codon:yes stop_codon:yes gene_type:complete